MFTFQPNCAETDLLTSAQKDALLKGQVAKVPCYYLREIPASAL